MSKSMGAIPRFVESSDLSLFTEPIHLRCDCCKGGAPEGCSHCAMHTARGTTRTACPQRGPEIAACYKQRFAKIMGLPVTSGVGLFQNIQKRGRADERKIFLK